MGSSEPVRLLDIGASWAEVAEEAEPAVLEVLRSGQWALGPRVEAFEQEMADFVGARHGIGVASGTDALLLALMALDVGPGDEVITTPFTFFSTASVIVRTGATPVFADIREQDCLLDPAASEAVLSARTRALMPVHLYGQCVDDMGFDRLARQHKLPIIEDACQAIGASRGIARAGSFGDLAAFSFYPTKNLSAAGDAGVVTTNDDALAARVQRLRVHGSEKRYEHIELGLNSRLDAVQAVILSIRLKRLADWNAARKRIADNYDRLLVEAGIHDRIRPLERHAGEHVFHQYVVRVQRRDELRQHLASQDIGSEVYYPIPLHLQECFTNLGYREGDFPVAERAAREVLALPIYPGLTQAAQERVIESIKGFLAS